MNGVVSAKMENCDQEIVNVNKQTLSYILKRATEHFLLKQYQKSRIFFEKAKKLYYNDPNTEEYGIEDIDLCIIDYALVKCYSTNKNHFQKRSEILTTLGERGKTFPPLSYEHALLLFQQERFKEAKGIINDTLRLISNVVDQNAFKAHWPSSNKEIPISNLKVLRNMLLNLDDYCQTELNKQLNDDNLSDDASYHSDSSSDDKQLPINIDVSECADEPVEVFSSFPVEPEPLLTNQEHSAHNFLVDADNNSLSISPKKITVKSKPSESSFINFFQDGNWNPVHGTDSSDNYETRCLDEIRGFQETDENKSEFLKESTNTSLTDLDDSIKVLTAKVIDSMASQEQFETNHSAKEETIHKNIDMILSQLIENKELRMKFETNYSAKEETLHKNIDMILSQLIENKELRMKIETLNANVENQKDYSLELERYYAEEDKLKSVKYVKLEVQVEELQKAFTKQEEIIKTQEQKIKFLEMSFAEQFARFCSFQKQDVIRQVNKCGNMISDLNAAIPYLTSTSAPTIDECRLSISRWEKQLDNVKEYSTALDDYFQSVFNQICNNESTLKLHQPELYTDFSELRDILHDNYIPTVVYFIKSRILNQNQPSPIPHHGSWYERLNSQRLQMVPVPYYQNRLEGPPMYKQDGIPSLKNDPAPLLFRPPNTSVTNMIECSNYNKISEAVTLKVSDVQSDETVDVPLENKSNSCIEDDIKEQDVFETLKQEDSKYDSNVQENETEYTNDNLQVIENTPKDLEEPNGVQNTDCVKPSCSSADTNLISSSDTVTNKVTKQVSDAAKAIGGPKFYNLFLYVKKKIPNTDDEVLLSALKNVRQKKVKLTGMTREDILKAVLDELIATSGNQNKPAWANVQKNYVNGQNHVSDNICVICYDQYDNASVTKLKCHHSFHFTCIRKWFVTNSICPVCRLHTAPDEDLHPPA